MPHQVKLRCWLMSQRPLKSYRDAFCAYGPRGIVEWIYTRAPETYRRFYASLMRRADRQIAAGARSLGGNRA